MQSDDPPFLVVGTEVSAKFKGAFCEAKVKRLSKSVKCKIALKEPPFGSIFAEANQIKGSLEVNQNVEVTQGKETLRGTIQHVKDNSIYHVVFNDGDERQLRRTQVCPKGAKHFDEAVNLDALPLYNPEAFSSPVVSDTYRGVKGRLKRQRKTQLLATRVQNATATGGGRYRWNSEGHEEDHEKSSLDHDEMEEGDEPEQPDDESTSNIADSSHDSEDSSSFVSNRPSTSSSLTKAATKVRRSRRGTAAIPQNASNVSSLQSRSTTLNRTNNSNNNNNSNSNKKTWSPAASTSTARRLRDYSATPRSSPRLRSTPIKTANRGTPPTRGNGAGTGSGKRAGSRARAVVSDESEDDASLDGEEGVDDQVFEEEKDEDVAGEGDQERQPPLGRQGKARQMNKRRRGPAAASGSLSSASAIKRQHRMSVESGNSMLVRSARSSLARNRKKRLAATAAAEALEREAEAEARETDSEEEEDVEGNVQDDSDENNGHVSDDEDSDDRDYDEDEPYSGEETRAVAGAAHKAKRTTNRTTVGEGVKADGGGTKGQQKDKSKGNRLDCRRRSSSDDEADEDDYDDDDDELHPTAKRGGDSTRSGGRAAIAGGGARRLLDRKRRRGKDAGGTAQTQVSAEETSPKKKQKTDENAKKTVWQVGQVVGAYDESTHKGKWFPAVVVSTTAFKTNAKGTLANIGKNDIPVRGFKDAKYFVTSKNNLLAVDKANVKSLDPSAKSALDRANAFANKGTLPVSWERNHIFGIEVAPLKGRRGSSSSINELKKETAAAAQEKKESAQAEKKKAKQPVEETSSSEESTDSDEYGEERDQFTAQLYKFHEERGTPINKAPILGGKDIDMFRLYNVVQAYGGKKRVTENGKWKNVLIKLKLEGCPGATPITVRNAYSRYLDHFNSFYRSLGLSNWPSTYSSSSRSMRQIRLVDRESAQSRRKRLLAEQKKEKQKEAKLAAKEKETKREKETKEKAKKKDEKEVKKESESVTSPNSATSKPATGEKKISETSKKEDKVKKDEKQSKDDKSKEKEKENDKGKIVEKVREKDKSKLKEKDKQQKVKEKEKDREKATKEKSKEKEKQKEREKSKEKLKTKEKDVGVQKKTHPTEKESSQLSEKTKATVVSDMKKTSKEDDLKKMPKPKEEKSDGGDVIAESVESAGVCSTSPCPSTVKQELSETVSGSDEEGRLLRATSRQRDRRKLSSRERRGTQSPGSANGSDQTATKDNDEATKDKDKCAGNERKERSKKIVDESYQPATVFTRFYMGQKVRALHHGQWYDARVITVKQPTVDDLIEILAEFEKRHSEEIESCAELDVKQEGSDVLKQSASSWLNDQLEANLKEMCCFVHYLGWNARYDVWAETAKIKILEKDQEVSEKAFLSFVPDKVGAATLDAAFAWRSSAVDATLPTEALSCGDVLGYTSFSRRRLSTSQNDQQQQQHQQQQRSSGTTTGEPSGGLEAFSTTSSLVSGSSQLYTSTTEQQHYHHHQQQQQQQAPIQSATAIPIPTAQLSASSICSTSSCSVQHRSRTASMESNKSEKRCSKRQLQRNLSSNALPSNNEQQQAVSSSSSTIEMSNQMISERSVPLNASDTTTKAATKAIPPPPLAPPSTCCNSSAADHPGQTVIKLKPSEEMIPSPTITAAATTTVNDILSQSSALHTTTAASFSVNDTAITSANVVLPPATFPTTPQTTTTTIIITTAPTTVVPNTTSIPFVMLSAPDAVELKPDRPVLSGFVQAQAQIIPSSSSLQQSLSFIGMPSTSSAVPMSLISYQNIAPVTSSSSSAPAASSTSTTSSSLDFSQITPHFSTTTTATPISQTTAPTSTAKPKQTTTTFSRQQQSPASEVTTGQVKPVTPSKSKKSLGTVDRDESQPKVLRRHRTCSETGGEGSRSVISCDYTFTKTKLRSPDRARSAQQTASVWSADEVKSEAAAAAAAKPMSSGADGVVESTVGQFAVQPIEFASLSVRSSQPVVVSIRSQEVDSFSGSTIVSSATSVLPSIVPELLSHRVEIKVEDEAVVVPSSSVGTGSAETAPMRIAINESEELGVTDKPSPTKNTSFSPVSSETIKSKMTPSYAESVTNESEITGGETPARDIDEEGSHVISLSGRSSTTSSHRLPQAPSQKQGSSRGAKRKRHRHSSLVGSERRPGRPSRRSIEDDARDSDEETGSDVEGCPSPKDSMHSLKLRMQQKMALENISTEELEKEFDLSPIDETLSGEALITNLQDRLQELRDIYHSVRAEQAQLDRRWRKTNEKRKQRERELKLKEEALTSSQATIEEIVH